jgi:cytochrome c biogenesis factor
MGTTTAIFLQIVTEVLIIGAFALCLSPSTFSFAVSGIVSLNLSKLSSLPPVLTDSIAMILIVFFFVIFSLSWRMVTQQNSKRKPKNNYDDIMKRWVRERREAELEK